MIVPKGVFSYLLTIFSSPAFAVMELPGLSFTPGLKLQDELRLELGLPISRASLVHSSFILVAAFGRCKFRLP